MLFYVALHITMVSHNFFLYLCDAIRDKVNGRLYCAENYLS